MQDSTFALCFVLRRNSSITKHPQRCSCYLQNISSSVKHSKYLRWQNIQSVGLFNGSLTSKHFLIYCFIGKTFLIYCFLSARSIWITNFHKSSLIFTFFEFALDPRFISIQSNLHPRIFDHHCQRSSWTFTLKLMLTITAQFFRD